MSSPFRPITHVRHVALAVPDYAAAVEFYGGLWGLEKVADDSGVSFWGTPADPEHYVVRLRKDDNKRVDLIAFGARNAADIDELGSRLGTAGVQIDREPGTLATPGGGYGLRFFDPMGMLVEVSADVAPRPYRRARSDSEKPQSRRAQLSRPGCFERVLRATPRAEGDRLARAGHVLHAKRHTASHRRVRTRPARITQPCLVRDARR
jgi:catechol 2,3-dioxygenase-like lactoylglutathione lyase family enzyme